MTALQIVNTALAELGVAAIAALDDTTNVSKVCNASYSNIKQALLEDGEWSFAVYRLAAIAADATAPASRYDYRFKIGAYGTILSVIEVLEGDDSPVTDYEVVDGHTSGGGDDAGNTYVQCDSAGPIYVRAKFNADEANLSGLFTKGLIAQCAADWAMPLTENRNLAKDWQDKADARIAKARYADGKQGTMQRLRPINLPGRTPSGAASK